MTVYRYSVVAELDDENPAFSDRQRDAIRRMGQDARELQLMATLDAPIPALVIRSVAETVSVDVTF